MFDAMMAAIDARPKNLGPMRGASAHAKIKGPCGDTVEVWLDIGSNTIQRATFMSDGCAYSVHCCSVAAKLSEGMQLEAAAKLTQEQVLAATGPVPENHRHCALLAANTIKKAIAAYHETPCKGSILQRLKRSMKR